MFSFAEKRRTTRVVGELPVMVRAKTSRDGWIDHVRDGGAVILDISQGGLQMSSDASHEVGQILRLQVPSTDAGGAELTVDAEVVWQKRNDINRFGRWSCGLSFKPASQAGIPTLLSIHWAQAYGRNSANKTPPPGTGPAA